MIDFGSIAESLLSPPKAPSPADLRGGRRNIYITPAAWELAASIGGGSASAGIKLALEAYLKQTSQE